MWARISPDKEVQAGLPSRPQHAPASDVCSWRMGLLGAKRSPPFCGYLCAAPARGRHPPPPPAPGCRGVPRERGGVAQAAASPVRRPHPGAYGPGLPGRPPPGSGGNGAIQERQRAFWPCARMRMRSIYLRAFGIARAFGSCVS